MLCALILALQIRWLNQIELNIYQIQKQMKLLISMLLLSALLLVACEQSHETLELDTPYEKVLNQQSHFTGKYIFNITSEQVKKLEGDRWFFFVEVEPKEEKEWVSTQIELSVGNMDSEESTPKKQCDAILGGVDSCFLTSKQFKYQTEQIHVRIRCRGPCKYKLSAEISTPFKITPGKTVKMDFENTAYSKVFTLDTSKETKFDQLRIVLRPEGFLQFPAPIGLYLNQDESIPTKERHDIRGMTLWDNGKGIFLDMPDAAGIFTILIEGPEKNVLLLETQLLSFTETNSIPQALPYFDYLGDESSKKYKVKVNPKKGVCLQMTTFSGAIKLNGIYDENLEEIDEEFAPLFRTYSELEYQLDAKFFTKNKDNFKVDSYLIFEIQGVKESTFVLEAYELNSAIAHLLPERTRYVEIPSEKYHQYYIEIVELISPQFKKSEFELILTTEEGHDLHTRFFSCKKEHGKDCELKSSEVQSMTFKNDDIEETSSYRTEHLLDGVQVFKFSIPASKFTKIANETKKYILTILLENKESEEHLYTIQYINTGKSVHLKEGDARTDRVAIDESRYYAFTNTNKDVKEIRIHVMEISGRVFMEGFWSDPRKKDLSGQEVLDYHNSVRFQGMKENQTVYLKITGKENAYYSVQLQIIKEGEMQWFNRTHPPGGKGYNEIIIVEGIPYEFNIKAESKEVFQIHSKESTFTLDITSLLPLELCMTENLKRAPFPPENCEELQNLTKSQTFDVTLEKGKIGNIGVTNHNKKDVKFNIRFSNNKTVKPIEDFSSLNLKCLVGVLGKINKFNFKKNTSSCYSYYLDSTKDDLEVMVDIISDEYEKVNVIVAVNDVEKVEVIGATHIFKKEELHRACAGTEPCPIKIFIDSQIDTEIRFTAQFLTGTFFLLDGIANQFTGIKENRKFVYELYNKVNTTIILENRNGYYKFYGSIVEAKTYWAGNASFPDAKNHIIESSNPFFYLYQISILNDSQIATANCTECLLLLTIVREQDSYDVNQKSRFVIECTQEDKYLKENQPYFAYLSHRSISFYEFYNSQNGSILVSINSQNKECVQIFIKQGVNQRASASNYIKKSQNSHTLVLEGAKAGGYSIALQAIDNCYFSIDIATSANEALTTIEQGHFKDLTLDKDESAKFIYENKNDEPLKILTLHVSGEITLNVKAYSDIKSLMGDNLNKTKYQWSGSNFLRIEKDDKDYCANCVYLIVVKAEKQTKTSIMIPAADSEFPIIMDSTIKDELKTDEVQRLRIFTQNIQQFEVRVQYGSIKIEILTSHNDKVEFTKTYEATQQTQYENLTAYPDDPKQPHEYSFMKYNKVKITALKNSGFTFGFISDKEEGKRGNKVQYGVPEYLTLAPKKRQCLRGTLNDGNEEFLISITGENQTKFMNDLEISCEVNSSLLELNKNIAKNEMIVSIEKAPTKLPAIYEFCMQSKENIFLTFIHSSRLNYFPENKALMVKKEMNLSFYAEGKSLIEVNECSSRAIVSISHSFNALGGINSEIRQVRKTNNIIEFNYYGPVYIHVEAASATVAWRRKDELSKSGFGYDEYMSSRIRLDKADKVLKVEIFPLKQIVDKPKIELTSVTYTGFLAEEEMNLYDAINCNQGTYLSKTVGSNTDNRSLSLTFDIESILKEFSSKKYILVGVLATAASNIANDSNYRFIYPYQQILIQSLKSSSNELKKEEEIAINPINKDKVIIVNEDSKFNTFVLVFTLVVLLGFLALWVYRRWIKKLLKRRRQQLSEQGTGQVRYQEFTSYT